jgi:exonuclease VII large subunit
MPFSFTTDQVAKLRDWRVTLKPENKSWYESAKAAVATYNRILSDASFQSGKELSSAQIDELFRQMKVLFPGREEYQESSGSACPICRHRAHQETPHRDSPKLSSLQQPQKLRRGLADRLTTQVWRNLSSHAEPTFCADSRLDEGTVKHS